MDAPGERLLSAGVDGRLCVWHVDSVRCAALRGRAARGRAALTHAVALQTRLLRHIPDVGKVCRRSSAPLRRVVIRAGAQVNAAAVVAGHVVVARAGAPPFIQPVDAIAVAAGAGL